MKVSDFPKINFHPIQPSVKARNPEISYQEYPPDSQLGNFIHCFWQLRTKSPLIQDYSYRVVSDGCVDIFFNQLIPSENFIMGFCRKFTAFDIGSEFNYIGVRFLPAAFPLLFGFNAKSLTNQTQHLSVILPTLSEWISNELAASNSVEHSIKKLQDKLLLMVKGKTLDYDTRFFNAMNEIIKRNGALDTTKELNTGLSARQLRRVFNYYIGTTPKAFSNVVRFQYILNASPSAQNNDNKIYYDVGFFDQAHYIKSFKQFYGITPSKAFS